MALAAGCAATLFTGALYELSAWGPAMLVVLALVVALLLSGPIRLTAPAKVALLALGALAAWAMLSMLWAESVDRSWLAGNRLALYAALLFAGTQLVRDEKAGVRVLAAVGGGIAALAAYLVGRMLVGEGAELFYQHRLEGPVGYVNGTSGVLAMGLWPLLALATSPTAGRRWRGAALGLATLEAQLLVLSQSRAVVPVVVVTVAVILALLPRRFQTAVAVLAVGAVAAATLPVTVSIYPGDRLAATGFPDAAALQRLATVIAAAALVAAALWAWASGVVVRTTPRLSRRTAAVTLAGVLAGVAVLGLQVGPSAVDRGRALVATSVEPGSDTGSRFARGGSGRVDLWRVALVQFRREPLLGVGAGNYGLTYYQLRRNPDTVLQPHSFELQVLAELGVVGAVALGAFLLSLLTAMATRTRGLAVSNGAVRLAATGVVVTWAIYASVDWLHNLPAITGLAVLASAVLLAARGAPDRPAAPRLSPIVAAVLVALVAMSVGRELQADRALAAGWTALRDDPEAALADGVKAQDLNPSSVDARYLQAAAFARGADYLSARDALRGAAAAEPHNHVPWVLLGDLATRRGDHAAARAAYGRALRLDPLEPSRSTPPLPR